MRMPYVAERRKGVEMTTVQPGGETAANFISESGPGLLLGQSPQIKLMKWASTVIPGMLLLT